MQKVECLYTGNYPCVCVRVRRGTFFILLEPSVSKFIRTGLFVSVFVSETGRCHKVLQGMWKFIPFHF